MDTKLIRQIKNSFKEKFNSEPLMAFAPGRINIIGEHTDYNEGFVFPAAIDKGIFAAVQKTDKAYSKVMALEMDETIKIDLKDIRPVENGGWKNYVLGVIAETIKKKGHLTNFNLMFGGNLPIGGGLSSSAALENSIGFAINELFQLGLTRHELIMISQRADHNYVGVKSGIMDQFASMFGKDETAMLLDCRTVEAKFYPLDLGQYQFLILNTNVSHTLANSAYNERRANCEKVAEMLSKSSLRDVNEFELHSIKDQLTVDEFNMAEYVIQENNRVMLAAKALEEGNLQELGRLLYKTHDGLQNKYKVSCEELDFLVDYTKELDFVLGARMMGGGFGGCTINLIKKEAVEKFARDIREAYSISFNLACDVYDISISSGTHLI